MATPLYAIAQNILHIALTVVQHVRPRLVLRQFNLNAVMPTVMPTPVRTLNSQLIAHTILPHPSARSLHALIVLHARLRLRLLLVTMPTEIKHCAATLCMALFVHILMEFVLQRHVLRLHHLSRVATPMVTRMNVRATNTHHTAPTITGSANPTHVQPVLLRSYLHVVTQMVTPQPAEILNLHLIALTTKILRHVAQSLVRHSTAILPLLTHAIRHIAH